jgi:hypothetical protein
MISQKHEKKEILENYIFDHDEAYEELFQATSALKFDYKKAEYLLSLGKINLNNKVVEKKHRGASVISNIIRWAPTEKEKIELLKLICSAYPDGKQIIKNASYVQTSLVSVAVRNKKLELAKYLINDIGMSVDQRDDQGRTPLFYLLQYGYILSADSQELDCLLQYGAKINVEDYKNNKLLDCVKKEEIKNKLQQILEQQERDNFNKIATSFTKVAEKFFSFFKNPTNFIQSNIKLVSNTTNNNNHPSLPQNKYQLISQQEDLEQEKQILNKNFQ